MARAFPWKCRTCGEQRVNPALVPDYSATLEHDGRSYSVTIPNLEVLECGACKARVLTDEAHKRLERALRDKAGLFQPEEIRAKREALGLTQKQLANLLKVAETTVCRWEKGAQIQQRAMDLLLRAFFDVPELRRYLLAGSPVSSISVTQVLTTPAASLMLDARALVLAPNWPRESNPCRPAATAIRGDGVTVTSDR